MGNFGVNVEEERSGMGPRVSGMGGRMRGTSVLSYFLQVGISANILPALTNVGCIF